jgi:hypothetical protein
MTTVPPNATPHTIFDFRFPNFANSWKLLIELKYANTSLLKAPPWIKAGTFRAVVHVHRSERMQMTDWACWEYTSNFSYTILMHVTCIVILFLLQPTNAQIYVTIYYLYIMLNPTCFDTSFSSSGSSKTCTTLIYINIKYKFVRKHFHKIIVSLIP